jgi:hypothetical protein
MKHLKSYNEGIRHFLKPKSEEEINNALKNLSPNKKLKKDVYLIHYQLLKMH